MRAFRSVFCIMLSKMAAEYACGFYVRVIASGRILCVQLNGRKMPVTEGRTRSIAALPSAPGPLQLQAAILITAHIQSLQCFRPSSKN